MFDTNGHLAVLIKEEEKDEKIGSNIFRKSTYFLRHAYAPPPPINFVHDQYFSTKLIINNLYYFLAKHCG